MLYISLALGLVFVAAVLAVLGGGDWVVERLSEKRSVYESVVGEELHRLFLETSPRQFIFVHLLCVLGGFGLGWYLSGSLAGGVLGGALGVWGPRYYLKRRWEKRIDAVNEQVEEAMVYMSNSFKANPSLPDAIRDVTESMGPPISEEFSVMMREYQLGTPLDKALINLQRRMPARNLELALSALRVGRAVGGNIPDILEDIADTIREGYRLEREIDAQTAQGRLQAWVMGMVPVIFIAIIYLFDPTLVRPLFESFVGYTILGGAAVLDLIGVVFIWRIVSIRV